MSENEKGGWFARMKQGLSKSSKSLTEGLMNVLVGGKEIDDEIRSIINERYQKALSILNENRDKLEEVTRILLEKETIMGDEFEAIMKNEHI